MSNGYLTGCALVISVLIMAMMLLKKSVNNIETKTFRRMLVLNIFESLTTTLIVVFALLKAPEIVFKILNRIDVILIISWCSLMFYYVYIISKDKPNNKVSMFISITNMVLYSLSLVLSVEIIIQDGILDSTGPLTLLGLGGALFYIVLMIIVLLFVKNKTKKANKDKYIPLYFLIFLLIIIAVLRVIIPQVNFISILLTLIDLIMVFTIENPDVKMVQELELAKTQAEKANRAKTDFLSSMSHEIRTPLNAIVGLSEIIKSSDDLDEIHEDATDVVNASNTLLEIVDGILDISRIEADKMEIVEVAYNPLEEFKSLVTLTETRIGEKEIKLRSEFAIDLPDTLYGDKGKVKQIITNLLSNAVKYTEKGYIDFKVSCINEKDISKLTITVSDTGRGIKKDHMDNLFTKFNRLDEDKNTTIEGTGLGLAITKSLVEMMGGKIVVDSTYGEGSKFTVFLSQKITNSILEEKEDKINTFDGKKVLVVDDNKLNLKVIEKILKEFNLDIDEAISGFECINNIENHKKYNIIFMDIMMPKMSGVETLKRLKQIEGFNTPVVALTADAIEGKSNKYIEVGFNDYLSKPIDKMKLSNILTKYLNIVEQVKKDGDTNMKDYDLNYLKENDIDVDASLELLGDIDMYNETLDAFIEENKTRIPRIEKNKNIGNMEDYAIDVHALKSDSKYLGFKKLAELSYDHELKSKDGDIDYVNSHYDELMNEYSRINEIINKYLEGK